MFHGLARLPRAGEEVRTPSFSRTFGGGALITAAAAARLGTRVEVVSALPDGADAWLASEGIAVRNIRRRGEPHAVSVALSTRRDRAFVTYEGVNPELETRLLAGFSRRLPRARHVHFALGPRRLPAWTAVLRGLRARGVSTSWDFGWHEDLAARPGFRGLLGAVDWIFLNDGEAKLYAGAKTMAAAMVRWRALAGNVVIKRGRRGATAIVAGGPPAAVTAPRVHVVDTTGAGDAFNGGFLAALVSGSSTAECLRAGVTTGSLSTRAPGGLEGLPSALELSAGCQLPAAGHRAGR